MKRPAISASMKLEALKAGQVQAACYICKRVCPWDQFHFDHIQALVDSGTHEARNLAVICVWCHREKSAFEHQRNSKSKRLKIARELHEKIVSGEMDRPTSKLKGRKFSGWRKFNGERVKS
jgi:epoxyqueuosine reductase QueG